MPDGAATSQGNSGDDGNTPAQEPLSAEEQVHTEIDTAQSQAWLDRLVGDTSGADVGGGGQNGKFMFANLAELDSVLGLWGEELRAIEADRDEIQKALDNINDPANDMMSRMSANTSRESLEAMKQHNEQMLKYTNDYIVKLEESREEMANQDASGQGQMRAVY